MAQIQKVVDVSARKPIESTETKIDELPPVRDIADFFGWSIMQTPHRLSDGAWAGHIPFAFWIVETLRPKVLVELGVHTGNSYSAFCQAVETSNSATSCYGIDSWEGDAHAGFYPAEIYREIRDYHDARYTGFSRLLKMTFNDGLEYFVDASVDLLHIDGYHTYDAVKDDF